MMDPALWPAAGSPAEEVAWQALSQRIPDLYRLLMKDPRARQSVVVVPSLSFDFRELAKITGVHHYEERMLVNLMLLRQPRTKMIYVTSQALDPTIIDYYLAMLSGVPHAHARKRLVLLHCADASPQPLSKKILERPRLMKRIAEEAGDPARSHIVCFNSTHWERTLAVRLNLPLHSVDPALNNLGTKSGSRETFRAAGVLMPDGFENLVSADDIARGVSELKKRDPSLSRAVIKLNDGFSGEGNAIFKYDAVDHSDDLERIKDALPKYTRFEAPQETWDAYVQKYSEMQGIVEAWVDGDEKVSPSAQCRVNAMGEAQAISTHDQVLGGPTGQVFLGATFPACDPYRLEVQDRGIKIAEELAKRGVIGRFGIDFVSVKEPNGKYKHFAIEINLRKGGTTHPFLTLKFLTTGQYNVEDGLFYAPSGKPKYYFATDTVQNERYKGLIPEDLVDIAVYNGLHFHGPSERGVVFHLIGALSEYGKLGLVAIGDNPQQARFLYRQTLQVLDAETASAASLAKLAARPADLPASGTAR